MTDDFNEQFLTDMLCERLLTLAQVAARSKDKITAERLRTGLKAVCEQLAPRGGERARMLLEQMP